MSSTSPLLQAEKISRRFGNLYAVNEVSLSLAQGEIVGLLGLNGAGKSTTLSILCGVLAPGTGWVRIHGRDIAQYPKETREKLGYLPDIPPLYPELRVSEYLQYAAKLRGIRKNRINSALDRALQLCQLEAVKDRLIAGLSKGFKQRVGLAQALIHQPELLILDEPSSGLDPVQMIDMRNLIRNLSNECGILLSTHILAEVTAVCSRVAILHQGRLIHEERLSGNQTQAFAHHHLQLNQKVLQEELLALPSISQAESLASNQWQISVPVERSNQVISEICARGWQVLEFTASRNFLEERFAALTVGADIASGASI